MAGKPRRANEGEIIEDNERTILSNMQYKEKEIRQKSEFTPESFLRKDDVLDRLGDMSILALRAMHMKLKVVYEYVPLLCPSRSGWSKDCLIQRVRMLCLEMIGYLGDSDALLEPLAKVMAVACLSSKLATGFPDVSLIRLAHFTPELEVVQNEK
ncbi:hypothetical protein Cgig2_033781 [Carnegiea gigantea]|uniref:Uncharacterized protein n=1 Tax=Carnegiea gigantea TaxID=171969 RepID=A0A9Q1QH66_9CARY|nr:hypothetical protein Cgig2_033781 [Carnegiea gigantea]